MTWNEKKQHYLEMVSNPECQLTRTEIAQKLGVRISTLRNWDREEGLHQMLPRTKEKPPKDQWATLRAVLYQKALDGDVPAAKLLLQMREMNLNPGQDQGITLEEALRLIQNHLTPDRKPLRKTDSKN